MRPIVVAHRAANLDADCLIPVNWRGRSADVVEADVHWFRGRLEVRHSKMLWPTFRLYEGRRLLPRSSARPPLSRVLDALPDEPELWLDLKGPDPRLSQKVRTLVGDDRRLWVSAPVLVATHAVPSTRQHAVVCVGWVTLAATARLAGNEVWLE